VFARRPVNFSPSNQFGVSGGVCSARSPYAHAFADSIFELYNELELQQLLNQFFERATYYSVAAYEEARERAPVSVARTKHEDRRATV
jgi:hypothetical protein